MITTKVAFLEGRLFSNQLELLEDLPDSFDWLDKGKSLKAGCATFQCRL